MDIWRRRTCVVIASTLVSVTAFVFLLSVGPSSFSGLSPLVGEEPSEDEFVIASVELGSEAYWKLPSTRAELVRSIQDATLNLQRIVNATAAKPVGDNVTRAVVIYLPPGNTAFVKEFKAMYLSLAVARTYQPANVKTDMVIFTSPETNVDAVADEFGCSKTLRASPSDPERCIVLLHVPLADRTAKIGDVLPPVKGHSGFADSIKFIADFDNAGSSYDLLMRTDMDIFLTPGFGDWLLPPGVVIATGEGGYGSVNANAHIRWVINSRLNLTNQDLESIGATWYGHSDVVVATAKVSMLAMDWLHTQEFNEFEQFHNWGMGWPYWHWEVETMYAGQIAVNQIPQDRILLAKSKLALMDYQTDHDHDYPLATVKHLHSWRGPTTFFAKAVFQAGGYNQLDLTPYAVMNTTSTYAGVIAVSSDRMTIPDLVAYINNPSTMMANAWQRLKPLST